MCVEDLPCPKCKGEVAIWAITPGEKDEARVECLACGKQGHIIEKIEWRNGSTIEKIGS